MRRAWLRVRSELSIWLAMLSLRAQPDPVLHKWMRRGYIVAGKGAKAEQEYRGAIGVYRFEFDDTADVHGGATGFTEGGESHRLR